MNSPVSNTIGASKAQAFRPASLTFAFTLVFCTLTTFAQPTLTIDATTPGVQVSPTLYGIFFEEINRAGDGGLYAEMLQNRSFEDAHIPLAWELDTSDQSRASWSVTRDTPLNDRNPSSLKVQVESIGEAGRVTVTNRGFLGTPRNFRESDADYAARFAVAVEQQKGNGHGIALRSGAEYLVSLHARAGSAMAAITIALESSAGEVLASSRIHPLSAEWQKHELTLTPSSDATDAALIIIFDQAGTYHLDMISLFPRDTFNSRRNGMRKDLAEMIAAMKPAFVRFPGGCFVEGEEIEHAVRWKDTIGDIAARPGRYNLWGYRSSDGLGFHEYLQFAEDLGAEPLFVINCGMSHTDGRINAYAVPMEQMEEFVQDALDAIEYCNGPVDSKFGALRAAAGHPQPFNLKYIQIGNENGGPAYHERYALFYDAIKAKHPDMHVITNVWEGVPHNRPFDIMDEHYYNDPAWFFAQASRYDSYDRSGAKVYVGEFAVTRGAGNGNLIAALSEAAFMTGMERNSDHVIMSSYAPLLVEPAWRRWNPNAIVFNASEVYGTPSYHVQALFGNHRPDVILPVELRDVPQMQPPRRQGRFGLGTWDTQAEFTGIRVTGPDGRVLWEFAPAKGIEQFDQQEGEWDIVDGAVRQTSAATPANIFAGQREWSDYTITLKARKLGGSEGFLISFHSTDPRQKSWWNIGGWGNRQHGIEAPAMPDARQRGGIEVGRWYDVKIELDGPNVRCYLDGELIQQSAAENPNRLYAVAGEDREAGEIVAKLVNPTAQLVELDVKVTGRHITGGRAIVLAAADPADENSFDHPSAISPRELEVSPTATGLRHAFAPYSLTVLRLRGDGSGN
jgi:alpha-L-arabinofuranosidase